MDPAQQLIDSFRQLLLEEREAGRRQFAEARTRLDPQGRIAAGLAIGPLRVQDTTAGALGRAAWLLAPPDGEELEPGVRAGDPVLLYRRRSPEEAVRALCSRRTRRQLTLVFDEPPDPALEDGDLVVEREFDETTHERLMGGLRELEGATKGRTVQWRELLAGVRPAQTGPALPYADARLNPPQREAVGRALAAEDVFLVHGPPGTGKTEVLAAIAAAEIARGGTVLACAASNAAVDNLVARLVGRGLDPVRLGHPARVHPTQLEQTLEAKAERHEKARIAVQLNDEARQLLRRADRAVKQGRASDRWAEARAARTDARKLFAEARQFARQAEDEILERADVVCATLTGTVTRKLQERRFTLALVDEATQATWPATVLALLRVDRVVLAGDQNQLPPTVISVEAARGGLSRTLYERLLEQHGAKLSRMLEVQHRMHREIMQFPSETLYEGRLVAHESVAQHLLMQLDGVGATEETGQPLLYLDSAGKGWGEETPEGSESKRNPGEAQRIVREVQALRAAGVAAREIGVIAPYAAQVQLLRSLVPDDEVEIDTVDAFQGREKEAILVSLTRSNEDGELGFCADVRRMNVALTRARRRLFVVGDSATLGGHPFYETFIQQMQARGCYRSAWEEPDEA